MTSQAASIKASLQRISIGSYVFQSKIADDFGLHQRDLQAISCLSLVGTTTAGELSQMLGLTSGATTTLIDRLVDAGFVRRRADAHDGRKVLIELGGPKLAKLRAAYASIAENIDHELAALPPKHLQIIATFLSKLNP